MIADPPFDDVFDAIKERIEAEWNTTLAPVYFENDLDGPPAGEVASWISITLDSALYGQESIGGGHDPGQNRWDERGALWIHVFTPRGTGPREARRLAKALANLFRGCKLLDDDLTFGDADLGAGDPGEKNGNYYLISVSIDWERVEAQ